MKTILITLFVMILAAGVALANDDQSVKNEVKKMLESRDQQIKELLGPKGTDYSDDQREKIKDIINGVIDYRAMAEHALQDKWNELNSAEKDEFVDVFSRVIRDQSLNNLEIYRADVTYEEFDINDKKVTVRTVATLENVRTPVIYDMIKKGGEWVVTDMAIDNVWTAASYQRSFQNIIRRRGYDALLENLKRRAGA